jgi:hypothetical protein
MENNWQELQKLLSNFRKIARKKGYDLDISLAYGATEAFGPARVHRLDGEGNRIEDWGRKDLWDRYCIRFSFDSDDFNKVIEWDGRKYVTVELKPQNVKYPLIMREMGTRKRYKFSLTSSTGLAIWQKIRDSEEKV